MPKPVIKKEFSSQMVKERIWTKDFILICFANFFVG